MGLGALCIYASAFALTLSPKEDSIAIPADRRPITRTVHTSSTRTPGHPGKRPHRSGYAHRRPHVVAPSSLPARVSPLHHSLRTPSDLQTQRQDDHHPIKQFNNMFISQAQTCSCQGPHISVQTHHENRVTLLSQ